MATMINSMNKNLSIIALSATSVTLACAFWELFLRKRLESKKPFEELPMPPNNHWLFGHMLVLEEYDLTKMFKSFFADYADSNGRIAFWVLSKPIVAVTAWEDARAILQVEYNRQQVVSLMSKHSDRFLGPKSIGKLTGKEWKFHRTSIIKSFSPAALAATQEAMFSVIDTVTATLQTRILSNNGVFEADVEPLMKMITLDIFALAAFSRRFGCCDDLEPSEIAEAFEFLGQDFTNRNADPFRLDNFFYSIPTSANRKHVEAERVLRSFLFNEVKERRDQLKKNFGTGASNCKTDLLTNLLVAHDVAADELSYGDEVSSQTLNDVLMSILFAGYDTSSDALTYALYLVSQYPDIEANCVAEIARAGPKLELSNLVYCKAVLYETLRMYPPAPATARKLQKPIQLQGGLVLPAGTDVVVPIWEIHRREQNFPRPNEFRPDRWAIKPDHTEVWVDREHNDNASTDIPAGNDKAFLAFSSGGKSCPGQKFAWQETTLVLAGLLKEFRFEPAESDYVLIPERAGLVQHPRGGIPMKISMRCTIAEK